MGDDELRSRSAAFDALRRPNAKRARRPKVSALIAEAEKAGKKVSSLTVDGVTLTFVEPEVNEWDKVLIRDKH
jgi:hypothetical protein